MTLGTWVSPLYMWLVCAWCIACERCQAKGAVGQGRSRPRGAVRSKQRSSLVVGEYLPREVRHEHGGVEHVAHGVLQ